MNLRCGYEDASRLHGSNNESHCCKQETQASNYWPIGVSGSMYLVSARLLLQPMKEPIE